MSATKTKDIVTEEVTCAGGMPAFVARPSQRVFARQARENGPASC